MITRCQIYKIIDQLPDSTLADIQAMLQDYIQYNTPIPRLDGLPVYDLGNPEHTKIILDRHSPKGKKTSLKLFKTSTGNK
ncbi:hypothetical protein Salpa_4649 [Sporomusa sp. KB1]|nr:hypothetical protein Salpa_4649 [Sporomusa sp. KB1]